MNDGIGTCQSSAMICWI